MKSVYLASHTNSTIFTRCCDVAILDDQVLCPGCREEVYPGLDATNHQRRTARWEMAYGPTRRQLAARNRQ
ncbi:MULTISPECIES: hypothetical protein [Pseudomonas]|uniref:hypothetical protein n=1 Tax=Pseudomonas TaxID=286 RepID=UPI00257AEE46|nr:MULTISPECIES: hypothetical protein [Pseudomonas]